MAMQRGVRRVLQSVLRERSRRGELRAASPARVHRVRWMGDRVRPKLAHALQNQLSIYNMRFQIILPDKLEFATG